MDVLPPLSVDDPGDMIPANAIPLPELALGVEARGPEGTHLEHLGGGQPGVRESTPLGLPPLPDLVVRVVSVGPDKEVIRPYACRVVAAMTDMEVSGYGCVLRKREAMREHPTGVAPAGMAAVPEHAIPIRIGGSRPKPTPAPLSLNVFDETHGGGPWLGSSFGHAQNLPKRSGAVQ